MSATQSSPSIPLESRQSASDEVSLQSTRQKTDPAWAHCSLTTGPGGKKILTCVHCLKMFRGGGINRVKQHLAGKLGDVISCNKVDADTRFRMEENLKEIENKKKKEADAFDEQHPFGHNVMELDEDHVNEEQLPRTSNLANISPHSSSQPFERRATDQIGDYFAPRTTSGSQPTIKSAFSSKEVVHKADVAIASFFL